MLRKIALAAVLVAAATGARAETNYDAYDRAEPSKVAVVDYDSADRGEPGWPLDFGRAHGDAAAADALADKYAAYDRGEPDHPLDFGHHAAR
jgi:hypothetical protein